MNQTRYCFLCGAPLTERLLENQSRLSCPICGWIYYPQLKVSAAGLIEEQGSLLLLRRARQPWQGCWNLPAGYVEADEDPRRAAERETLEECGLQVQAGALLAADFFNDDPRGHGLLLVYRCQVTGGCLQTTSESESASYFLAAELPENLTGAAHDRFIYRWAAGEFNT